MEEREISIKDIFKILKIRWKVILSFTLISTLFSIIMSYYIIIPKYSSSTKFFVGKQVREDEKFNANDIQVYQKFLNTYAELITTQDLIKSALENSDLDTSVSQVLAGLSVTPKTDTQILQMTYICNDKNLAKSVLDAVSDEFIKEADELIPNGEVKIVQKANTPQVPITPNKPKNIAIGFLAGLMLGILAAFWLEYINNNVKSKEDIENIIGLPVIGLIPLEK